jgi:hypothetical protein
MKTMLKVTLVVALFAFANTVFASGNLKVNILPVSGEKALVDISTLTNSNLKISVANDLGQLVYYNETTEPADNYRKLFNFSDLEDGHYLLSVESLNLTTQRSFQISNNRITVGDEKSSIEPFFGYKDGLLRCTYLNFTKDNLTLDFYSNSQLIYSKEIGHDFAVSEALSLAKLDKGNYTAVLSTGTKSHAYEIAIK